MATNFWLSLPAHPISGSLTVLQGTVPWIVSGTVTTSPDVNIHDSAGNPISSTGTALDVNVVNEDDPTVTNIIYGDIVVTSTPIEAKVGITPLPSRLFVTIIPTTSTIYWGSDSSVTILTGLPILTNQSLTLNMTDSVPIYLVSSGTVDTRIAEGA